MKKALRFIFVFLAAFVLRAESASSDAAKSPPLGTFTKEDGALALTPKLMLEKDAPPEKRPFWKTRPELQEKIREDRAIIVSVKRADLDGGLIRFTMMGAGEVARPKEFCFAVAQQYEKLKEVSDHFKTVTYDVPSRQLLLITEALGYQARMIMRVQPVAEDWRNELQWEVIWGHFKGMTGYIGFERAEGDKTEVSISAKYEAMELPLPKILMGFALEVITQKVAERMRAFIEAQPTSSAKAPESPAKSMPNQGAARVGPLAKIRLPRGFSIEIFAPDVPGARRMAFSKEGDLHVGSPDPAKSYVIKGAAESLVKSSKPAATRALASGEKLPAGISVKEPLEPRMGSDRHPKTKQILFIERGKAGAPEELKAAGQAAALFKLPAPVGAHGMRFYTGSQFPADYRRRIFIAERGHEPPGGKKTGFRVSTIAIDEKGRAGEYLVFADGWLENESAFGRPVDVLNAPDGSLLVSDDQWGVIYRISYKDPEKS